MMRRPAEIWNGNFAVKSGREKSSGLTMPVQAVDATPSDQLIRQYFPWRSDVLGCINQNLLKAAFRLIQPSERFWLLFSMQGGLERVLRRPIDTTRLTRS